MGRAKPICNTTMLREDGELRLRGLDLLHAVSEGLSCTSSKDI
jgi:hypothetical protein